MILVYDITSRSSFLGLEDWIVKLKDHLDTMVSLCILGNKLDLAEQRVVQTEELREKAMSVNAAWFETSALKNSGVDVIHFLTFIGGFL